MGRWEPDARGRLAEAAMRLYQERGFDRTTVAEIAERAGLTERTFFRYFADKREVLFFGAADLQRVIVESIAHAPARTAPLDAVAAGLEAIAPGFEERRSFARQRHALIVAHPELQEREVMKLTSLAAAAAEALRGRGVAEPAASLTAEAGISVFKVAFEQWIGDARRKSLGHHIRHSLRALRTAVAGKPARERTKQRHD
ncbi:MAG TPA: TetR family transcriptional regulator [Polyangia bacterium]|jgi:AcrR family transcriptional regulator